jgi:hypothetical protein
MKGWEFGMCPPSSGSCVILREPSMESKIVHEQPVLLVVSGKSPDQWFLANRGYCSSLLYYSSSQA